jgi:hypothetical protein
MSIFSRLLVSTLITASLSTLSVRAKADFLTGRDAAIHGDYATAYNELLPLAENGHAASEGILGAMYRDGLGVERSLPKAFFWTSQAAQHGQPVAEFELGRMYELGIGVETNAARALEWYSKSAAQGIVDGKVNIGFMYLKGAGIRQDYDKARV